jgi:hypothetical protein
MHDRILNGYIERAAEWVQFNERATAFLIQMNM